MEIEELLPEDPVKREIKKYSLLGIVVLLFFLMGGASLLYFEAQKILSYDISSWTEDQRADCGVVLTGGGSRIAEGFSLLSQKRVRKLIVSGVHPTAKLNEIFPQIAFYGRILPQDVILEKKSRTTYGNAQQTTVLIDALQCRDIVLISSRSHMYRSMRTFRANLPKDFPIYERAVVYGRGRPSFDEILLESIKSLFYSLWAY